MQRPFVFIGHNNFVTDIADIVHACDGFVHAIVENMEEPHRPHRKSLRERLPVIEAQQPGHPVRVLPIAEFEPVEDALYVIAFSGAIVRPVRDELVRSFGITCTPLVHPTAMISPTVVVSPGCIINTGAILASGVELGEHVLVNRGATIGHDTRLDDFSIVQPGANIAGHVHVAAGAVVGIGASIIEDRVIGENARVAAGAAVTRDVPPNTLVAGVPAVAKKTLPAPRWTRLHTVG